MKKIFIPPTLVFISLFAITGFYFLLPAYNLIAFPLNLLGIAVCIAGFMIMGRINELFSKNKTTLAIKHSSTFVRDGLFAKTRNPMYIGMFLLLLGAAFCFRNVIALMVPFIFILIMNYVFVPREEKLMAEVFGAEYLEYKKTVRRWI